MADEAFSLFTSLRYDPALRQDTPSGFTPLYLLSLHRDRILRAAAHFQWEHAIQILSGDQGLSRLASSAEAAIGEPAPDAPRRVKLTVDQQGTITAEAHTTAPVPHENLLPTRLPPPGTAPSAGEAQTALRRWTLVPDDVGTAPCEHTHYKTTRRALYVSARRRRTIALTDEKEVLLINGQDGTVMEGSIATPYFWRGGRWVTPPVPREFSGSRGGGQDGTTRRWALEKGIAVEEPVQTASLRDGEECWISNGVRGFIPCQVSLE